MRQTAKIILYILALVISMMIGYILGIYMVRHDSQIEQERQLIEDQLPDQLQPFGVVDNQMFIFEGEDIVPERVYVPMGQ